MTPEKQLDPEKFKILSDYCYELFPNITNFRYIISDDGKEIKFTSDNIDNPSSEDSIKCFEFTEKLLNTKFKGVSLINGDFYFIYKFK